MMLDAGSIESLVNAKEWGLILMLIIAFCLLARFLAKSVAEQNKANGSREEQLTNTMITFSKTIPELSAAINALRSWLEERFDDVTQGIDDIREEQKTQVKKIETLNHRVDDHETRIGKVEAYKNKEIPVKNMSSMTAPKQGTRTLK